MRDMNLRHARPILACLAMSLFFANISLAANTPPLPRVAVIDCGAVRQTIHSFGASDCWNGNFVGRDWPEAEREKAARWLFSRELDANGNPLGIGLSMWRFNLGAGTDEQGDASDIPDRHRRAECFLRPDGSWDWTKQAGQQWFLRRAKDFGVESFVAFSCSPPVQMTRNGRGYAPGGADGFSANLKPGANDAFADFLAECVGHFAQQGLAFDYISPLNEPQWDWKKPTQEGSPWHNSEIAALSRALDAALNRRQLATKIIIPESAQLDFLYKNAGAPHAGQQAQAFFAPESPDYVGNLARMAQILGGHSYWTIRTNKEIADVRREVLAASRLHHVQFFQTECSLLGSDGVIDDAPKSDHDVALFFGKIIHADLTLADAASWSFWTAMEQDFKDQLCKYRLLGLTANRDRDLRTGGTVEPTPTLWVLGHFSRFVRPGHRRVEVNGVDALGPLMMSAYVSPTGKEVTVVIVHLGHEPASLRLDWKKLPGERQVGPGNVYITDAQRPFARTGTWSNEEVFSVPPRALVTAVFSLQE